MGPLVGYLNRIDDGRFRYRFERDYDLILRCRFNITEGANHRLQCAACLGKDVEIAKTQDTIDVDVEEANALRWSVVPDGMEILDEAERDSVAARRDRDRVCKVPEPLAL